ncbi:MAG: hypothetical protein AB7I50_05250 [Vicinamibacterales bacterium]
MSTPALAHAQATARPVAPTVLSAQALRSVLFVSFGVAVLVVTVLWFTFDGSSYYRTPLEVRGYHPAHALLRPSGPIGQTLGVCGAILMAMPFFYMLRKRIPWLSRLGGLRSWLELHIFCGIVGPVLVTFHTSFKFNGIVSTAYWSMVIVALSGFVGRYLYVRIPRRLQGEELTEREIAASAEAIHQDLAWVLPPELAERFDDLERRIGDECRRGSLLTAALTRLRLERELRALEAACAAARLPGDDVGEAIRLGRERLSLAVRIAYLQKTRNLFALWHVFHLPLVYLMFVVVALHIGIALYMGYVPFRW